jgi:phage terminase small subunit
MRRKSPDELRVAGTARKDRAQGRPESLSPTKGVPRAPKWLSVEALAEWRRITGDPVYRQSLCLIDAGMLATYCQIFGQFVRGEKCDVKSMIQLAGKFALSPADRVRVPTPKKEKQNAPSSLTEFLQRNK